jgi:hypothetical protein
MSKPEASSASHATQRQWVLTLELEPLAVTAAGAVTMKVTILRIRHTLGGVSPTGEIPLIDLDSAGAEPPYKREMGLCLAPIGESFTAVVSAQGRMTEVDSKAFCVAVARKRMQYEDEAIRREATERAQWSAEKAAALRRFIEQEMARAQRRGENTPRDAEARRKRIEEEMERLTREENNKRGAAEARRKRIEEEVEKAIRSENKRYGGTAAQREQHYRDVAAECHLYSLGQIRWLLNDLLVPFPYEPAAQGSRWTAPFMMAADGPIELEAAYTLVSQDGDTCTIQVEAQRSREDKTLMPPPVPSEHRTSLAGTYKAVLKIDRATGVLLSKEASADLTGRTSTYIPPMPGMPEIKMKPKLVLIQTTATTTVELLP